MTLTITIQLDNSAFEDDMDGAIKYALRGLPEFVAETVYSGATEGFSGLRDPNGNTCGRAVLTGKDPLPPTERLVGADPNFNNWRP